MRRPSLAIAATAALIISSGVGVGAAAADSPNDNVGVSGTDLQTDEIGRSKNVRHLANLAVQRISEATGTPNCRAHPSTAALLRDSKFDYFPTITADAEGSGQHPAMLVAEARASVIFVSVACS